MGRKSKCSKTAASVESYDIYSVEKYDYRNKSETTDRQ